MNFPAWKDQTADQKFEFLHEWCDNLSRKVDQQRNTIDILWNRLQEAEAKTNDQPRTSS
jgi:hypothetical protein